MKHIVLNKPLPGSILDIGCGGEGFIGRAYGNRVTGVDVSQEELDEAPDCFTKVLMDAAELKFENACFDNVTFFYSLMFMSEEQQKKAVSEAARVLKYGGSLMVWDCEIQNAYPEPFCVDVDVMIRGNKHHTTYGILKHGTQSCASISKLLSDNGLTVSEHCLENGSFCLEGFKR